MGTGHLTELQLTVMKALWAVEEGTVSEVLAEMQAAGHPVAPTTAATLLQRLAKQGWVSHRKNGRHFVYRAQVGKSEAASGALRRLLRSFFDGRPSALTAQLLGSKDISAAELEEMRRLLDGEEA